MKSRGIVVLAQSTPTTDYVRHARVLAQSIRHSQSEPINISIIVDKTTEQQIGFKFARDEFDSVIILPHDDAQSEEWKIHNKWQVWNLSPYTQTIWLDADMIVSVDLTEWWSWLAGIPILFSTAPIDYRGFPVKKYVYRGIWKILNLPLAYTTLVYFEKTPLAKDIFDATKEVYYQWPALRKKLSINREISGDLAFSLALKLMKIDDCLAEEQTFFRFVHMKPRTFSWEGADEIEERWTNLLSFSLEDGVCLVNGYRQMHPFHYVLKDFIQNLEQLYAKDFKNTKWSDDETR